MDLLVTLAARGGIMRTRSLAMVCGRSTRTIDRLVARGALFRPRQGWIALPGTDPELVSAAEAGVVLTCVTQAKRLGLWDAGAAQPHVAVGPHHHPARPARARLHWSKPLVPRHPDALADPVQNVLAVVAECQPHETALAIWESALRHGLVDLELLRTIGTSPRARQLAEEARPYADAGTESNLTARLRWLRLPMRRQVWLLGHRVDLLIGERLVIQIDGGNHVGAQRSSDNAHDARLMNAGYHVIRVTSAQLMSDWPAVQDSILHAIARGLHLARA